MHKSIIAIVILTIALLMAMVVTAQPGTGPDDWPPHVLTHDAAQQTVTVLICESDPGPWCVELTSVAASCAENFAPYCFELTPQATPTQERAVSPFNAISAPAPMDTPTLSIAVTYEPVRPLHSESAVNRIVAFITRIVEGHNAN